MPQTFVTDAGLAHLKNSTSLEALDLQDCNLVSNAGVAHLVGLNKLRDLKLWGVQIDDGVLDQLARMRAALVPGVAAPLTPEGHHVDR